MGSHSGLDIASEVLINDCPRLLWQEGDAFLDRASRRSWCVDHRHRMGVDLNHYLDASPDARKQASKVSGCFGLRDTN